MVLRDIMSCKEYEKDGQKKKVWLKVGTLRTTDNNKQFIELNMLPGIPFFVFEQKPKEGQKPAPSAGAPATPDDVKWEE